MRLAKLGVCFCFLSLIPIFAGVVFNLSIRGPAGVIMFLLLTIGICLAAAGFLWEAVSA